MNDRLKRTLAELPESPGVYIMRNSSGEIIYIGKAKVLKNRVSSYFINNKKNLKTRMLVSNIDSLEYILTASESDAFSLENNLIKQHKPKYNILLKDDKNFPYIRIDRRQKFPEVTIARRVTNDGANYFGPFVTGMRVSQFIEIIKTLYPIRQCKVDFSKSKNIKRQCLYGDMGNCSMPCMGKISEDEYNKIIDDVVDFLNGDNSKVKRLLKEKMDEHSKRMEFEEAIDYRTKIEMLDRSDEYILTTLPKNSNIDIFSILEVDEMVAINQVVIRNGKTIADKTISVDALTGQNLSDILSEFLAQYYAQNSTPNELLTNIETPNLGQILASNEICKFKICVPRIGLKKKMIEISEKNIREFLAKNYDIQKRKQRLNVEALVELSKILNLEKIPYRIECYDISNISGTNSVASMVVFENGEPNKKEYRKFKIKTVDGADDFKSMEETLTRRFMRLKEKSDKFKYAPDIVLIDGGLGQLHSAVDSIRKLGYNTKVLSIAKKEELIFVDDRLEPLVLDADNIARKLLQRLRDEAHRFAITFHRSLRDKGALESVLDGVKGLGKVKRRALIAHFKDIGGIIKATKEDLIKVEGIGEKQAELIIRHLTKEGLL